MKKQGQRSRGKPKSERSPSDLQTNGESSAWTFLTNHAHVLIALRSKPDQTLREVAATVGITERAVQRIVHELEEEGFLRRERVGRQNRYELLGEKHLRHPLEAHCEVNDLLSLIADTRPAEQPT